MCIYIYIHIYIYLYICMHIYTHTSTYTHICVTHDSSSYATIHKKRTHTDTQTHTHATTILGTYPLFYRTHPWQVSLSRHAQSQHNTHTHTRATTVLGKYLVFLRDAPEASLFLDTSINNSNSRSSELDEAPMTMGSEESGANSSVRPLPCRPTVCACICTYINICLCMYVCMPTAREKLGACSSVRLLSCKPTVCACTCVICTYIYRCLCIYVCMYHYGQGEYSGKKPMICLSVSAPVCCVSYM